MSYTALIASERPQFMVFLGLSLATLSLTAVATFSNPLQFQRFLGKLNPLAVITGTAVLGGFLLAIFIARGWFAIWIPTEPKRFVLAVSLAVGMTLLMILVDVRVVFPHDLNVPFPNSLVYYPAIDYALQVLVHVLPLAVLLIVITAISNITTHSATIWLVFVFIAAMEPLLQTTFFAGEYPTWVVSYVAFHVFVFNLIELAMFKRYDFITMYSFRLAYYLAWHIVWGFLRLRLLF